MNTPPTNLAIPVGLTEMPAVATQAIALEFGSIVTVDGQRYEIVQLPNGDVGLDFSITPMAEIRAKNGFQPAPPGLFKKLFGHLPTDPEG